MKSKEIAGYYEDQDCNEKAVDAAKSGTKNAEKECTNYSIKSKQVPVNGRFK